MKPRNPARTRSRHGLNAVKAQVKVRGLQTLDRRTVAARGLLEWRSELLADLGGQATISAQQMALVEMAVRTRLYIDHADAWLLEQGSLVNARKRSLIPLLRERQTLVDSLVRILGQLGLERRARPVKSLNEVIHEIAAQREGGQPPAGDPATESPT